MAALFALGAATAFLAGKSLAEQRRHLRRVAKIPIRIHVNGTRGKSSVTRLIAAGLRASGRRVFAKTTGSAPRLIFPDGSERELHRRGPVNIDEQARLIRWLSECRHDALVVECMALTPHAQRWSESKLIRATHAVITNARADHLGVMGPTTRDVAKALAGTTPLAGLLVTAERRHVDVLAAACERTGSALEIVDDEDLARAERELAEFTHLEHTENVAIALRLCRALGVPRELALAEMIKAAPDPGAACVHERRGEGRHWVFVNGFAANDPESTEALWRRALRHHPCLEERVIILNCREDRWERTKQFAQALRRWPGVRRCILVGEPTSAIERESNGQIEFSRAHRHSAEEVVALCADLARRGCLVFGAGNFGGAGERIAQAFAGASQGP